MGLFAKIKKWYASRNDPKLLYNEYIEVPDSYMQANSEEQVRAIADKLVSLVKYTKHKELVSKEYKITRREAISLIDGTSTLRGWELTFKDYYVNPLYTGGYSIVPCIGPTNFDSDSTSIWLNRSLHIRYNPKAK